ncbi:PepSY domain-containing protein [Pseudomonas alabamensis]|jgi:hypothetical protein|uniref:PepSY domain-containing protein n=1 Tax=Pseudomonas alabamensis TaxID=3064349 RepID=UPI000745BE9B|nr:peptidase [Pseudomonas monteilii]
MKALTRLFTGLALVGSLGATAAWADQPGADWKVDIDQALQAAKGAGYSHITEIKIDDGHWEGKGTKADGMKYEFQIDPRSGAIVKEHMDH